MEEQVTTTANWSRPGWLGSIGLGKHYLSEVAVEESTSKHPPPLVISYFRKIMLRNPGSVG